MIIDDIALDDMRLPDVHRVLVQLRPHLTLEGLRDVYAEGYPQGLRFTAVFVDGLCQAVAGWRVNALTFSGRKLYVDDLVTDAEARSHGHGRVLLQHLEQVARDSGCTVLDLDSGVHRHDAHRFYLRERMVIAGHHFVKPLD